MTIIIIIAIIILIIIIVNSNKKPKNTLNLSSGSSSSDEKLDIIFPDSETKIGKYFIFDCETTGLPKSRYAHFTDLDNYPYIVQIAWAVFDEQGNHINGENYIVRQQVTIPDRAYQIHGISTQKMKKEGINPSEVYSKLMNDIKNSDTLVAHNLSFDLPILQCDLFRNGIILDVDQYNKVCTMMSSIYVCELPRNNGSGFKYPKLTELVGCLFYNTPYIQVDGIHDARLDMLLSAKCFFELKKRGEIIIPTKKLSETEINKFNEEFYKIKQLEKENIVLAISKYESLLSEYNFKSQIFYRLEILYRKQKDYENEIRTCTLHINFLSQNSMMKYVHRNDIEKIHERKQKAENLFNAYSKKINNAKNS
jgi:DNA polymerase III subunit epsilon